MGTAVALVGQLVDVVANFQLALTERAFALRPLLDVAPDAVDPRTGVLFQLPAGGESGIRRTDFTL